MYNLDFSVHGINFVIKEAFLQLIALKFQALSVTNRTDVCRLVIFKLLYLLNAYTSEESKKPSCFPVTKVPFFILF